MRKETLSFVFLAGLLLIMLVGWAFSARSANTQQGLQEPVRVEGGMISGTPAWGWGVRLYRGVPYAAPPVGDLRWRPPQPVVAWKGVLAADHYSAKCMQHEEGGDLSPAGVGTAGPLWDESGTSVISEDCLYLNIWTPARSAGDNLPVMIWFHGGGGKFGAGSEVIFDGSMLAKKGVIWVTTNYRLGIFGNFAHPELTAESEHHASGNYAEFDKLAAIRWVKNNIAQFGGNPNNITVLGHSSASRSLNNIVASPLAKDLFQHVIAHSHTSFGRMQTLREAEAQGVSFGESVGAHPPDARTLSSPTLTALRRMPAKDLEAAAEKHPELIDGDAYVDGWFLPEDVNAIFSKGKENAVSLLTGAMNDEHGIAQNLYRWRPLLTVWVHPPKTKAEYLAWARDSFGEDAERLLKVYAANSDTEVAQAIHDIGRDSILQGQRVWTQFQSKDGRASAYLYNFSHKPPVPSTPGTQEPIIGAIHGAEFYYTFDNLHVKDLPWTDTDRRVADSASSYWTNFAKTGDPNGPGLPHWQAYNSKYDLLMNIGDTPHAEPVQNKAGLDFLSWWDQHFRANQGKGN